MVAYNTGAGILRAIGDPKTPFMILVFSGALNVVLDLIFVSAFDGGVAGVSWATFIAQMISAIMIYQQINHKCKTRSLAVRETVSHGRTVVAEVVNVGIPSGMQGALISFSNLFIWRYVNSFGVDATAGVGIAQRLDKFVGMPCKAIGVTTTTFVCQNIGARNYSRIREGVKWCFILSVGVTLGLELMIYPLAEECVSLFNSNPEVIIIGVDMFHVIIPLYLLMAVREVLIGTLRGHGYSKLTTVLSLIGMVGLRQLYLWWAMAQQPVIENIYRCYPLAWGSTAFILLIYYQIVKRSPSWEKY